MLGRIVALLPMALLLMAVVGTEAYAQAPCRSGFVWRDAFRGDFVCVPPQTREETRDENMMARSGWVPGGGVYGPHTCVSGLVWRNAGPNDVVCVTPRSRDRAAADNAAAGSRVAGVPMERHAPPAAAYRVSEWSPWARFDGVEYRYRWGWDPSDRSYVRNVDAIFEMRSRRREVWRGTARTLDCERDMPSSSSQELLLAPGEVRGVRFRALNCGSLEQPFLRGSLGRVHRH